MLFRQWLRRRLVGFVGGSASARAAREPSAGIIDAQSVRAAATVPTASRGYDGGKDVPGRKRHILTDTLGLLLLVAVTAASIGYRDSTVRPTIDLHVSLYGSRVRRPGIRVLHTRSGLGRRRAVVGCPPTTNPDNHGRLSRRSQRWSFTWSQIRDPAPHFFDK